MANMMRMTSNLACVCLAFVAACAWGEGSPSDDKGGGVDASVLPTNPVCGDGVCAASEIGVCTVDCGSGGGMQNPVCGNGTCETGETQQTCAQDCGPPPPVCGNGTCENGESQQSCPQDCGGSNVMCPVNIEDCALCVIAGFGCPPGHDQNSCSQCLLPV